MGTKRAFRIQKSYRDGKVILTSEDNTCSPANTFPSKLNQQPINSFFTSKCIDFHSECLDYVTELNIKENKNWER